MLRYPVFTIMLLLSCSALAQKRQVETYKARVVTIGGSRFRGVLDDVTDRYLFLDYEGAGRRGLTDQIPLNQIRKVIIRHDQRKNTIEGAIVGGGLAAFATIRSSKKNGFSSPVVYGLNLAIAVGAGAGIGALIGRNIGPITRKTIRPFGQTPDEAAESLRRQLEPFTYSHQSDILNRVPQ